MCTAITYQTKDHYFGRNLDLEYSYREAVTVTPRNYVFHYRHKPQMQTHYAIIGMAMVSGGYPLYYDATNEHGLSIAGLNFPGNAVYQPAADGKDNITPFELIPWILGQCKDLDEALTLLKEINLLNEPFSAEYPLSPLHWILADKNGSITVEPMADGLKIYQNPVGVLTNNPPFDYHLYNLKNYLNLTSGEISNRFAPDIEMDPFCRGLGAYGLPGDASSPSRFIRAAFTKLNSVDDGSEHTSVGQFFHILGAVAMQHGCVQAGSAYDKTVYTSCCNTDKGIYYYTTYENSRITGVDMHKENLDGSQLVSYPMRKAQEIRMEN